MAKLGDFESYRPYKEFLAGASSFPCVLRPELYTTLNRPTRPNLPNGKLFYAYFVRRMNYRTAELHPSLVDSSVEHPVDWFWRNLFGSCSDLLGVFPENHCVYEFITPDGELLYIVLDDECVSMGSSIIFTKEGLAP